MAESSFIPAVTGNSRVFLIDGRARFDHRPAYQSNMKAGGLSQGFGDITDIEIPSSDEYSEFIKVGEIRDQIGRVEISLMGRYAAEIKSEMLKMSNKGCSLDAQINIGACTEPTNANIYTKKILIENAFITNYETEDLGALGSDEQAKVDETISLSGRRVYEYVGSSYASRAGDIVTNELVAGFLCDSPSCGDCLNESDGCQKYFSISLAAGGSPGTPADVVFTLNAGDTFQAHDIDTLGVADDPNDISCLGAYLFVVSEDTDSLHYALLSEFDGVSDPVFTEVATGFVSGGGPRAISSTKSKSFIVGGGGYIYTTEDVTGGVTVSDAGVLTNSQYNDVHALNDDFAVAVGDGGVISVTRNGSQWSLASMSPVGIGVNINTVQVKSERQWVIGTNAGNIYYTLNGGESWTIKGFTGSGSGSVEDISIVTDSIMYLSHTTAASRGRILKSTDGGQSWTVEPSSSATLPLNDRINSIVACPDNPNTVFGVGLADDGSDGFIVVGTE